MPRRLALAVVLALLALPFAPRPGQTADPDHLVWARRLVAGVTPDTNLYASRPTIVTWTGVNGAGETRNRSVCSALVAHLFEQAYGYRAADFVSWLGGRFPRAAGFHDAVAAGRLHVRIGHRYPLDRAVDAHTDLEGRRTTGKVLLVP